MARPARRHGGPRDRERDRAALRAGGDGKKLLSALAHVALGRGLLDGQEIYDCGACAREPELYEMLGHDAPPDGRGYWTENLVTGAPMTLCPIRTLQLAAETDPGLVQEVRLYWTRYEPLFREHGLLLVEGGMADQPARFWSFLEEIARLRELMAETFARLRPPSEPAMGGA